jgi:hypothetical protein
MSLKSFLRYTGILIMAFSLAVQTGCVVESISGEADNGSGEAAPDEGAGGGEDDGAFSYAGCVDGQGVGTKSIQLNFLFPPEATRVRLNRNGNQIAEFTQANSRTSHIDDDGLREGATYLYTCEALVDGLWNEGTVNLQLSTLAVNAPQFSGIADAVAQTANSVMVSWVPSISDDPVSAFSYQIFANVGDTVDWTVPPRATVLQGSPAQSLVENLGDELKYSFGVRACSEGDICETNMIERSVTNVDSGAPTSVGATALLVENGILKITAPWTETDGGLSRRYVYIRKGATGGTNIGDYTLERTYQLTGQQLFTPPTTLEISPLEEGVTYHVIVQDEDPSAQRSAVTSFQTLAITDITPPSFGGVTNILAGTPSDSVLNLSWTGIATEGVDPINGGDRYRILSLTSTMPIAANPCLSGEQIAELNVSDYTAGAAASYDLTGLDEKSYYSICIKALDAAGNISNNSNSLQRNTLDITPPDFIGVQGISFDNQAAALNLSWNASAAADLKEYRITLWVNQPTPPGSPTVLVKTKAEAATGVSLTGAEFPLNDNDEVYALVEACDLTEPPFGTQNCSTTGVQRSTVVPDVTPPPNFIGIRGPTDIETPVEGEFLVKWNAPADWSDYRGFRIYQVNPSTNALTLMKTCQCVDYGCTDQITQCTVNGLDPFRTYRLHVRAYDAQNNETIYIDPSVNYSDKRTSDTTPPTFASNLVVGASPTFALSWNAAVDSQYSLEPGSVVTYEVYQNNAPFDFTNPNQPDGNLKTSTPNISFQDSGFIESQIYYYTVCAKDASNNISCDQLTRNFTVPDVTAPVITNLVSTKTIKGKVWELNWTMSDNISATNDLFVEIRRRISIGGDLATGSDEVVYSGLGSTLVVAGNDVSTTAPASLDPLSGPAGLNRKINYLVVARDQEGNEATSNITVNTNNAITLTSVRGPRGPIAGGKLVTVYGTGFSSATNNEVGEDTVVRIAGNLCTGVSVLSENAITCTTPAVTVPGTVEVRVIQKVNNPAFVGNTVYAEASVPSAYEYISGQILCDTPGSWGPSFAAGTGTNLDPYIICDEIHLANIRPISNTGSSYRLGDSIDLAGSPGFLPLGNATTKFTGSFDGAGHVILNWTYSNAQPNIGFLGFVNGDFEVKSLGLVNVDITASQSIGGLIGVVEGGVNKTGLISDVFVTGNISGGDFVGGLIGRKQNNHVNFNMINSYFVGDLDASGVTGYGGGIVGFLGADDGGFFQDIYSEGNITGSKVLGGLFGNLGENKQLIDSFSRATVTATGNTAGGLAGEAKAGSTITNSYHESGDITGVDNVGGLLGIAEGILSDSYASSVVNSTGRRAGGIVGYAIAANINDVYTEKTHFVNNSGGGLVGELSDSILTNSYASGGLIATGNEVGGLVGKIFVGASESASISQSYSIGLLDTLGTGVGGLVGSIQTLNNGTLDLDEVFSRAQVGTDFALPNQQYGGLIGKANTGSGSVVNITNCYASGGVYAGAQAGGLFGGYDTTGGSINIDFCYSVSPIFGGSGSSRGGVYGKSSTALNTISNSFWDTEVSLQNFASTDGGFNGTVTGQTTAEMQDYGNSIYVGWDFSTVWLIPAEGYPQLQFEN